MHTHDKCRVSFFLSTFSCSSCSSHSYYMVGIDLSELVKLNLRPSRFTLATLTNCFLHSELLIYKKKTSSDARFKVKKIKTPHKSLGLTTHPFRNKYCLTRRDATRRDVPNTNCFTYQRQRNGFDHEELKILLSNEKYSNNKRLLCPLLC